MICLVGRATEGDPTDNALSELWDSLGQYIRELALAESIAVGRIHEEAERLQTGSITTLEFRKRCYHAVMVQAFTFEYISSKPDYAVLNSFLWLSRQDGKPPKLAWCLPELAPDREEREWQCEEYYNSYIDTHWWAIDELTETLREYEQSNG